MQYNAFPALTGNPVTEAHVKVCAEKGHATHTVSGKNTGACPRCGVVTSLKNRNNIKITHRDGRVTRETRVEHECVKLTQVYNRTAYNARIIDVCVEWDD